MEMAYQISTMQVQIDTSFSRGCGKSSAPAPVTWLFDSLERQLSHRGTSHIRHKSFETAKCFLQPEVEGKESYLLISLS